jgi:nitrite reductase/ring-hydroxylating ferredoxin subunit
VRYELCAEDALQPGEMREADAGGLSVVLCRKPDGSYRALRNRCSHHGAPLHKGLFEKRVDGDTAGYKDLNEDVLVVRCPWHGYEFDVETGKCPAEPDKVRVKAYDVVVEDGKVFIER